MKYSVIIPTLNEEVLLPRLLNQLNEEKIKNKFSFEIIISDGGSSDDTLTIAKKFSNKVITNERNNSQNIAEGRNLGAASAFGDVLIFLNGDVVLSDAYAFFEFLERKFVPSHYLAFTSFVWIFPEEAKLIDKIFHGIYNLYFWLLNYVGVGMGRGECQVIKKEVFEEVGGYNINCAAGEDFELYTRIRRLGKILFTSKVSVYESPRRFRKLGYLAVSFSWILNSFLVFFKKKSLHKHWEQIR